MPLVSVPYVATLLVEDWTLSERCKSCNDVCLKGGHDKTKGSELRCCVKVEVAVLGSRP